MGGKSGGTDTGPMLEYGNKALKLQERIYDEQRADAQPWYQTGTSAVNQLGLLMGLNPSQSASSRQSLIDQYKPQFTSSSTTSGVKATGKTPYPGGSYNSIGNTVFKTDPSGMTFAGVMGKNGKYNWTPYNSSTTTQTTDNAALNAYVDNLLSEQSAANQSNPLFGTLAKSFSMDDFEADPGYQFRLGEGTKALERKLNASGKTYSPEAAKALMSYGQQLGSEEYNNAYNRFNINQDNLFNRLATLSGFGQTASGQIANAGSNYANAGSDLYTGMGNSITAANIAKAQQGSSMFNTLLGAGAQLGGAYLMGRPF